MLLTLTIGTKLFEQNEDDLVNSTAFEYFNETKFLGIRKRQIHLVAYVTFQQDNNIYFDREPQQARRAFNSLSKRVWLRIFHGSESYEILPFSRAHVATKSLYTP